MTGYTFTEHAKQRIAERNITPDELASALAGDFVLFHGSRANWYCRRHRVQVVVEPATQTIVTVVRLTRRKHRAYMMAARDRGGLQ